MSGAFSIIYTAAVALVKKAVRPEHMNREAMEDPVLKGMIAKIAIDPSLPPDEYQTAEVDVTLQDGTSYHARCDVPKGDIYRSPLTEEEVLDKFYRNIEFSRALPHEAAVQVVEMIAHMEELEDIGELVAFIEERRMK